MFIFPKFSFALRCNYSLSESRELLQNSVKEYQPYSILSTTESCLRFSQKNNNILYKNAFLPIVDVEFTPSDSGTNIITSCRLKTSIKIIMVVYLILAIIFETVSLYFLFTDNLSSFFVPFIPIVLVAFMYLMTWIGLKFSSKKVEKFILHTFKSKTDDGLAS